MSVPVATVASLLVLVVVAIVAVKVTRAVTGTGTPRRRELQRVVRERHEAVLTKHQIQRALNLWRPSVTDETCLAFMDTIQGYLTELDQKLLTQETDK